MLASEGKSCRPQTAETPGETITTEKQYMCQELSVGNKWQKSHLLSQNLTLYSTIYLPGKKFIGTNSILALGKSCFAYRPPFYSIILQLTTIQYIL